MKNLFKDHLLLILFLIFYFSIITYKLIAYPTPFYDWDESINAQVGKEMIQNKTFIPSWQNQTWLDKPPLAFLFYGLIMTLFPFISAEISTRIATLILTILALAFVYTLYFRATKDKFLSLLTVIITSFIPIFLQRSQITNLDVFMLLGWVGYALFFENFTLGLIFLAISVFTKSLIGFYPAAIMTGYYIFLLLMKKITFIKFKDVLQKIVIQIGLLSLWYIYMLVSFGDTFWKQHIIESHFRRVTASIESHFGKKTYYLDLMIEQFKLYGWLALLGLGVGIISIFKTGLTNIKSLYTFFLLPWFLFLNLTKTKIFWYMYPSLAQFAFLAIYPLGLLKKQKILFYGIGIFIIANIFYNNFIIQNFFTTQYSKYDDNYYLATYAKNICNQLNVLVEESNRNTAATLESMNLTITTTKWWGNHPSTVYYFGKKVNFIYDQNELVKNIQSYKNSTCLVLDKNDLNINPQLQGMKVIKQFNSLYLFKKS